MFHLLGLISPELGLQVQPSSPTSAGQCSVVKTDIISCFPILRILTLQTNIMWIYYYVSVGFRINPGWWPQVAHMTSLCQLMNFWKCQIFEWVSWGGGSVVRCWLCKHQDISSTLLILISDGEERMERMSDLSNTILDPVTTEWYPGVNMLDLSEENILLTSQASIVPDLWEKETGPWTPVFGEIIVFLASLKLTQSKDLFPPFIQRNW